jgi:hypothetical protein
MNDNNEIIITALTKFHQLINHIAVLIVIIWPINVIHKD